MQLANFLSVLSQSKWVLFISFVLVYLPDLVAAPMVTAESSTVQVRKGQDFKVYLAVTAQESIKDLHISIISPIGFDAKLEGEQVPGVLESGSSYTIVYEVTPPSTQESAGGDTRERKRFVFNLAYTAQVDGSAHQLRQSLELPVDYSTSPVLYMICGVLGAILGNVIKTFNVQKNVKPTTREAFTSVFREEIAGMLTSIVVAFVVLLMLSRDTIPAKGWYDSLALGVAVAVFSDDQLLTKVKQVFPKI